MLSECSLKLIEEPHVIFKIESQIIYHVFEHGDAFNAHAEGVAAVNPTVNFAIIQHIGVNHTTSHDLHPFGSIVLCAMSTHQKNM